MIIICFSIFSGIDCSESFRICHLHDSVTCLYISITHYLGLFIYVLNLASSMEQLGNGLVVSSMLLLNHQKTIHKV